MYNDEIGAIWDALVKISTTCNKTTKKQVYRTIKQLFKLSDQCRKEENK